MRVKIDLNFLAFPLWFQVSKSAEQNFTWQNAERNYEYNSSHRTPDQLDMLFALYLIMRSQAKENPPHLNLSRYEILKGCSCPINPQYLKRLEESLERWQQVGFQFKDSFHTPEGTQSQNLSLLKTYHLPSSQNKRLKIELNPLFLSQIQNSTYFKYILFDYYKALHRPVSRRLYEILTWAFKHTKQYKIPLVDLGHLLTLYSRKKRNKQGEWINVIYPSDVLTSLKAAINEMNKLATDTEQLRQMGMDPKEVYAVAYEVDTKRKTIEFTQVPLTHLFDELLLEPTRPKEHQDPPEIEELYSYLKRSSKNIKDNLKRSYKEHGYDYVKWNIFYANQHGLRNYNNYLKLCFQHNWAQELREEYECLFGTQHKKLDERKRHSLIKVAEKANFLVLRNGKRFKIKRVYPNGAIEIVNRTYKMNFVLSPAEAYDCRFES